MPDQDPTVGQANSSLRAQALDAAWWLRHWSKAGPMERATINPQNMAAMADRLDAAVKASNDALDREAFRPCQSRPS